MEWPDPIAGGDSATAASSTRTSLTQDEDEEDMLFETIPQKFNLLDARREKRRQRQEPNGKSVMRQQIRQLAPKLDRYTRGTAKNRNGEQYQIRFEEKDVPHIIDLTKDDDDAIDTSSTPRPSTIRTSFTLPAVKDPYSIRQTRIPLQGEEIRIKLSSDSDPNRVIVGRVKEVIYNPTALKSKGIVTLSNLSVATNV